MEPVNGPLSSLEKFGVLARKFLHDTSNDFTAIGLNLHFVEKSIEPEHPAYKDFKNLATALKNLQQNTRGLLNCRRQLPDPLQSFVVTDILSLIPADADWMVYSEVVTDTHKVVKVYPLWMNSLVRFLSHGQKGNIRCKLIDSPNDQCATAQQVNVIFEPVELCRYEQLPEIEWSIHRELAKLMGGGIAIDPDPKKSRTTLFLPVYT